MVNEAFQVSAVGDAFHKDNNWIDEDDDCCCCCQLADIGRVFVLVLLWPVPHDAFCLQSLTKALDQWQL